MERQRESNGRYAVEHACHACGKPAPITGYYTDDEVCGLGDGPGFILCDRKRCLKKRDDMTVEQRRELYAATVATMVTREEAL